MSLEQDFSLKGHNTFGIEAKAENFFSFEKEEELFQFAETRMDSDQPFFILGGGSNVLFRNNFAGIVLHSKINTIEKLSEDESFVTLRAGSGLEWDTFVDYCVSNKYYGIENLSLIPGNIGAAPVQNIGAYGTEVKEVIEGVWVYDLGAKQKRYLSNEECNFEYRNSIFKNNNKKNLMVLFVDFTLHKVSPTKRSLNSRNGNLFARYFKHLGIILTNIIRAFKTLRFNRKTNSVSIDYRVLKKLMENLGFISLRKARKMIIKKRNSKIPSPSYIGNAGSFFKNPVVSIEKADLIRKNYSDVVVYPVDEKKVKISAGWLIKKVPIPNSPNDTVGLYKNQTLIVVNKGNATGEEIFKYSEEILQAVQKEFDIKLEREVVVI